MDCLFCKIAQKEIPARVAYEDQDILVFEDIAPKAPVHLLIIPRRHITSLNELASADVMLAGKLLLTAKKCAQEKGISDDGYRLVFNCNEAGGQTVFHLHAHLMGGRSLTWPPG